MFVFAVSVGLCAVPSGYAQTGRRTQGRPAAPPLLIGTRDGLFSVDSRGAVVSLWTGGPVQKIIKTPSAWILQSGAGIVASNDLRQWTTLNQGLPVKTIKLFSEGKKSFTLMVQEIKDLDINRDDPAVMVCATKDQVFLSRNGGASWTGLGMPPFRTNGIKAVAAVYLSETGEQPRLTVFMSHSTYGLHYIRPDSPGAQWTELNEGLEKLETTDNADEVSDIAAADGASVYVSQTFRRKIYRLDWDNKRFNVHWAGAEGFGTVDSLSPGKNGLRFLEEGTVGEIAYEPDIFRRRDDFRDMIRAASRSGNLVPACVLLQEDGEYISLNELWLLDEEAAGSTAASAVPAAAPAGREGLYLPVNHAMTPALLKPYLDVISGRGLNMIVIDMKDDYGRLRFTPKDPEIPKKGRVFRPLDIDAFLKDMKERGIYTVARIVVFKDPELAKKDGGKYAVWDASSNKPWAGYFDTRRKKSDTPANGELTDRDTILPSKEDGYEILRTFYDEQWVDPYSEDVWEYTAALAAELHERGFDEIQFDYIRFPTDGVNLRDASYRWQDPGMDMESAILSFLRHIRARVSAPISIDIYGANGWYRTGARTGQEVELLAPWVDVICPMYYPSHFEQDFLAQEPAELRPYRIYYQGTLRTARIGRGRIIVRPYVQAFYLNVSYDRAYYNADYVRRETQGTRDAGNGGLTYWNNSGRYDDIPKPARQTTE